jgi:hypothetical protein
LLCLLVLSFGFISGFIYWIYLLGLFGFIFWLCLALSFGFVFPPASSGIHSPLALVPLYRLRERG